MFDLTCLASPQPGPGAPSKSNPPASETVKKGGEINDLDGEIGTVVSPFGHAVLAERQTPRPADTLGYVTGGSPP